MIAVREENTRETLFRAERENCIKENQNQRAWEEEW